MRRLKVDENLPHAAVQALREAGHDVMTVAEQQLTGSADSRLSAICAQEARIVITLDRGFANPQRQTPPEGLGVVVLRPATDGPRACLTLVRQLLPALAAQDPTGSIWVVSPQRIRVRRM